MKVLMYIRCDYKQNLAGDSIQLIKTQEYVSKLGVDVTVSSNPKEDLRPYDVIHLFNTIRVLDTYLFFQNANRYHKKIILTPIYWNYAKYMKRGDTADRHLKKWQYCNAFRKEVIEKSHIILPSSEEEMRQIEEDFQIKRPYHIVPNGVDKIFANEKVTTTLSSEYNIQLERFVLSVGRICPHKNQLSLAQITQKLRIPLLLVGPINDLSYFYNVIKHKNVQYISKLDHEALAGIYRRAKVHALVSWYEIPGLVNLEAGLSGCTVLTTTEGSTKEYLKSYAYYADPQCVEDIEDKLKKALHHNHTDDLKKHILENFIWEKIGEKLVNIYKHLSNE